MKLQEAGFSVWVLRLLSKLHKNLNHLDSINNLSEAILIEINETEERK